MIVADMEAKKAISFKVYASANESLAGIAQKFEMDYRDVYAAAFLALASFTPDLQASIMETFLLAKFRTKQEGGEMVEEFKRVWAETQSGRSGRKDLAQLVSEAIRASRREDKDHQQGQG